MKKYQNIAYTAFTCCALSISLFSPARAETINILPLGDSITQGGRAFASV